MAAVVDRLHMFLHLCYEVLTIHQSEGMNLCSYLHHRPFLGIVLNRLTIELYQDIYKHRDEVSYIKLII